VLVENLPAEHFVHSPDPKATLYVPAAQLSHASPSGPVLPGMHLQAFTNELPDKEFEPAGQSWQEVVPRTAENLPEGHRKQIAEVVDPHLIVPTGVF